MQSRFEQFAFEIAGVHRYVQRIERDEMRNTDTGDPMPNIWLRCIGFPRG